MPKVNMDKVRAQQTQFQAKADKRGRRWYKFKDGMNVVRILPPWSDEGLFAKDAGYHYNVAAKTAVACPKVCKNKPCPVCETASELFKSKRPEDIALARKIGSKSRYFLNVLDRDAKDGKVYILGVGPQIYEQVLQIFSDKDYGDITDLESGWDLKIVKEGEGMETKYKVLPAKAPSKVIKWDDKKKELCDFDKLIEEDLKSYEWLKATLEGTTPPDEDGETSEPEEEDAEPGEKPAKAAKPAAKPKAAEEEEEGGEAEEKEEEESEGEGDAKPAKKKEAAAEEEGGETAEPEEEESGGKAAEKPKTEKDKEVADALARLRNIKKDKK